MVNEQLDSYFARLKGSMDMLERAENNVSAMARIAPVAADFYSETNSFAVSLSKPELLSKELFLWLANAQNLELVLEIIKKHVSTENRVNACMTLYSVLTSRVEELYLKWHKFNQLYIDDLNYLQMLEGLLSRLAVFHSIDLPVREIVKHKTIRNYEPIRWETILARIPELA